MSSYGLTRMWLVNPARGAAGTATTDLPARLERLPLDQRQQDSLSTPHAASLADPSGQ
jgi:hypothetical protein